MAVLVKHAKTSAVPDGGNAAVVQPSDWNANHTVTGAVEEAPTDNVQYARQSTSGVPGWQVVQTTGLSTAEYTYSTNTSPPPSTGQLRANTTTQGSITSFYLHYTNAVGVDISNALRLIVAGDKILLQDKSLAANYHYFTASADAVDNSTYLTIPVTHVPGGTAVSVGRVIFAVFGLGTGGGGALRSVEALEGGSDLMARVEALEARIAQLEGKQ